MAKHLSVPVLPPTGPATGLESGPSHPRLSSHVTDATISPSTAQNGSAKPDPIQVTLNDSHRAVQRVEESITHIKQGLDSFRELLKDYQTARNKIERDNHIRQRAEESWLPSLDHDADSLLATSEKVAEGLPPLRERLSTQLEVYEQGRLEAVHVKTQLEWHAAPWTEKLRKVLLGQVREKRLKLLRIAAPFLLGAGLIIAAALLGRLSLYWAYSYYQNFRRSARTRI